jgi:hypothetical protein
MGVRISFSYASVALLVMVVALCSPQQGMVASQRLPNTKDVNDANDVKGVRDVKSESPPKYSRASATQRRRLHDYDVAEETIHSLNRILEVDDLTKIKYSAQYFTEHLQNKRIVLIGDSITRYQYLSLVYALSTGHFLNMSLIPNPVVERSWPSWHDFYVGTHGMLQPFEYCDCFRGTGRLIQENENRYYFDNVRNISVVYLMAFRAEYCFGHWSDWGKHSQ